MGSDTPTPAVAGSRWAAIRWLTPSRASLLKTIIGQYGIWAANLLIPLAIAPYIARVLGPSGLGLYGFCQAVAGYPILVIEYGFVMSGARAIAETTDSNRISAVFSRVTATKVLLGILAIAGTALSGLWIPEFRQSPMLLCLVAVFAIANGFHPEWYFRGRERLLQAAAITAAVKVLTIPAILIWVRVPGDTEKLMAIQAAAAMAATMILLARSGELPKFAWPPWAEIYAALKDGGWLFLVLVSQTVSGIFTPILLKALTSVEALGFYYVANRIQGPFWHLLSPFVTAVFPRMVSRIAADRQDGTRLAVRVSFAVTALASVAAAGLAAFSEWLVWLFAGDQYGPAVPTLRVLALLIPFVAGNTAIVNLILIPYRRENTMFPITLVCGVIVVAAAILLVPRHGPVGMALALVIAEAVKLLMCGVLARSLHASSQVKPEAR
jgi:polysaccharide transporter, PST family